MAAKERWHKLALVQFSTDVMRAGRSEGFFSTKRCDFFSRGCISFQVYCNIQTFRSLGGIQTEHVGLSSVICRRHLWFCLIVQLLQLPI